MDKIFSLEKTLLVISIAEEELLYMEGKKEFTGATILSAQAALRTGAGSVKIICSKETLQIYSVKFPSVLKTEINSIFQLENFLKKRENYIISYWTGLWV